uniref:Uncharacterized protein n=1 Tax=Haptolina ericina TaxID=156174 RepID=A0A7S3C526_9EUKA
MARENAASQLQMQQRTQLAPTRLSLDQQCQSGAATSEEAPAYSLRLKMDGADGRVSLDISERESGTAKWQEAPSHRLTLARRDQQQRIHESKLRGYTKFAAHGRGSATALHSLP